MAGARGMMRAALLLCAFAAIGAAHAAAPGAAPPPTARPGASTEAAGPAVKAAAPKQATGKGVMPLPAPRPPMPSGLARSGAVEAAAAQAFDLTPRPRPRPAGLGFVPPQDLTAHAANDMADDGPAPARGAVAPGEVTGGTRSGFDSSGLALIGIFGAPGDWRALVRMPAGKVDYVQIGARIDGWQVAAISGKQVQLIRGLQSRILTVPDH